MAARPKKLKCDFNYVDLETERNVLIAAGTVVTGKQLEIVKEVQPTWLVYADDEIEEEPEEGRLKDLRLTEPEKPAKPKDEDPKDPDKPKK